MSFLRSCHLILFTLLFSFVVVSATAEEVILVNRPLSADDKRYDYPQALLLKILERTSARYGPAHIEQAPVHMKRDRTLHELMKGNLIHVMAEAPKPEWVEKLLPVRIPIRKGIQGFRLFLIRKENQSVLSKITTLGELKAIATGTGAQWSTTRVLEKSGFNAVTGNHYEGLFDMLMSDRFMTFGRGINEVFVEYESRKETFPDLAVEQDLLLYIPLPTYFFISPTKPHLAERIKAGLLAMIDDGTFDEFFEQHFGPLIQKANLSERKIFKINNPNLSQDTPLAVEKFWYKP